MGSYFYIISALAVWSSWGLVVRWLDLPVHVIAFYNALFGLCFQGMGLWWVSRRTGASLRDGLGTVVLLSVFSLANLLFYFYALKTTTVAGAMLTHYTAPVFVAALAPMLVGDRTGRAAAYALVISSAGLLMIFTSGGGVLGGRDIMGLAAGTASGLAYAFVIIISRRLSRAHHPLKIVFMQGAVSLIGLGLWTAPSGIPGVTLPQVLVLAMIGLVHSTIAVAFYLYGIRGVTAQEAGVLGYLEPVLGIVLAFFFMGETPPPLAVAGGLMILVSGSMVILSGQERYAGGLDDNRG